MFEFLKSKEVEAPEQSLQIVESEFSIAADKINQRIATTENRIREELDSLLKDLSPIDIEIETQFLRSRDKNKMVYTLQQSVVSIMVKLHRRF